MSKLYFEELNKNKSDTHSNKLENNIYELEFEEVSKLFKLIEDQNKV